MKTKKFIPLFVFAPILVLLIAYGVFTIHMQSQAKPALLAYLHSGYPHITESDLSLSELPTPTRNGDIRIIYSFVYNKYGEKLYLQYYYRNTKPIESFKQ